MCMANQIATAIIATTIAAPTSGVIFFELPLRGEALAAWLNSVFIAWSANRSLPENRAHLVPQRLVFAIAVGL